VPEVQLQGDNVEKKVILLIFAFAALFHKHLIVYSLAYYYHACRPYDLDEYNCWDANSRLNETLNSLGIKARVVTCEVPVCWDERRLRLVKVWVNDTLEDRWVGDPDAWVEGCEENNSYCKCGYVPHAITQYEVNGQKFYIDATPISTNFLVNLLPICPFTTGLPPNWKCHFEEG